jgi:hypothetical protein
MAKAARKTITASRKRAAVPDPILSLIDDAHQEIQEVRRASLALSKFLERLGDGPDVARKPPAIGPDHFRGLFYATHFYSNDQIDQARRAAASRLRTVIAGETRTMKRRGSSPDVVSDAKANAARARLELAQLGEASEWLKRELRRDIMSVIKLRQKTGFDKVNARKVAAEHNAEIAVRAVGEAKPRTFEGAVALIKFIADAKKTADWIDVADVTDVSAVLYRAFDALRQNNARRAAA